MSPMRWRRPACRTTRARSVQPICSSGSGLPLSRNAPLGGPTANHDPAATRAVEDIVLTAAESGIKILMASHDLGQVRRLAGDVIFLARGALCERKLVIDFLDNPSTPEGVAFLRGDLVI